MIKRSQVSWWGAVLLVLCFAPLAFSQTVSLTLDNGGPYTMDGVYVGPYNFTETQNNSSKSAQLICDDFKDEVYPGESWTAKVTSFSSINSNSTGLMFYNSTAGSSSIFGIAGNFVQGYEAMAYLATQMLPLASNPSNATTVGYMAYAIWAIFEPSTVKAWLSSDSTAWAQVVTYVQNALKFVESNNVSPSYFAGWEILTPITCTSSQSCPPQEYFQYVPEGGAALAYLLMAGVSCYAAMLLRRRRAKLV